MAYKTVANTATTVVASRGNVRLERIVVGAPGTTWVVTIWNNASAASGESIGPITVSNIGYYDFGDNTILSEGLTISSTGTAGVITVIYS